MELMDVSIWTFHNRSLNHNIRRLNEQCLLLSLMIIICLYEEFFSIYHRNLQVFTKEMFSIYAMGSFDFINEISRRLLQGLYRNQQKFATRPMQTVHYGSNLLNYLGLINYLVLNIKKMVSRKIRNLINVDTF